MQIYIASSWRNQHAVEMLTDKLRESGHEILSFVENGITPNGQRENEIEFDVESWICSNDGLKKFQYDTNAATNSDLVIYIGPSGTDAWAEVGAAWASGVPIIGLWAKGEPAGLMRRMVKLWCPDYRGMLATVSDLALNDN